MVKSEKRKVQLKISNKRYIDKIKHTKWFKAKCRIYTKKYRDQNKEKVREQNRTYKRSLDPKQRNAILKIWFMKNPDKIKEYRKKYRENGASRRSHLKARYGITIEQFDELLAKQNNVCAICLESFEGKKRCIDHCHKTGKIRGILHINCNSMLGKAKDNIKILQRAIKYLKKEL